MTTDAGCDEIRLLLPDFALGTLTGQERAHVLEHLGSCAECQRELQSLVDVADGLLLLAPVAESPVGFESRVLDRLPSGARSRSRPRRWAALAAAVLAAASIGGGAIYLLHEPDRELAENYRAALGVANGEYVAARDFVAGDGREVGYVFGYQGSPSWIFCVLRGTDDGTYDVELRTKGDTRVVGEMQVRDGSGSWHQVLDIDLHDLASVRLVDRSTGSEFVAGW